MPKNKIKPSPRSEIKAETKGQLQIKQLKRDRVDIQQGPFKDKPKSSNTVRGIINEYKVKQAFKLGKNKK